MTLLGIGAGKGSPGSTFVAMNLAASLADRGISTLLLDLDPAGGDLAAHLALDPRAGLYPLMRLEGTSPSVEALLSESQNRSGVLCIAGFPRAEDVHLGMIESILEAIRGAPQSVVIADMGRIGSSHARLFDMVDSTLIVARPDLVGAYAAQRAIRTLTSGGCGLDSLFGVVNGWQWKNSANLAEAVDSLPIRVIGSIALDAREARKALLDQTFIRRGRARKGFASLSHEVMALASVPKTPALR